MHMAFAVVTHSSTALPVVGFVFEKGLALSMKKYTAVVLSCHTHTDTHTLLCSRACKFVQVVELVLCVCSSDDGLA